MARVITFSVVFPSYHPKAGNPTCFVNMILHSVDFHGIYKVIHGCNWPDGSFAKKNHTIRKGNRWKAGDKFSPRIWTGKPYNSLQQTFFEDIEIKKVWTIEIWKDGEYTHAGIPEGDGQYRLVSLADLAKNDGLSIQDLIDWFNVKEGKPFVGQIICWSENVEY